MDKIDDMCLTEAQKCDKAEAEFMAQSDDETVDLSSLSFGTAIVPADQFMRLQCLKVAEHSEPKLSAEGLLEFAKKYYDFVTG